MNLLLLFFLLKTSAIKYIFCSDDPLEDAIVSIEEIANVYDELKEEIQKMQESFEHRFLLLESQMNETIDAKNNELTLILAGHPGHQKPPKEENSESAGNATSSKATLNPLAAKPARSLFPKDCQEVMHRGHTDDGVYVIQPDPAPKPFLVFCDMTTEGGGWTYIVHRFNGQQSFKRQWYAYKVGFGSVTGELWLGLDKMNYMTGYQVNELLIELEDWNGDKENVQYSIFSVGDEIQNYTLQALSGFEGKGNLTNDFQLSEGMQFSTIDVDNDATYKHCAEYHSGGWWYHDCGKAILTGAYYNTGPLTQQDEGKGILWASYHDMKYSLKTVKMMIRPRSSD